MILTIYFLCRVFAGIMICPGQSTANLNRETYIIAIRMYRHVYASIIGPWRALQAHFVDNVPKLTLRTLKKHSKSVSGDVSISSAVL